MNATLNATPDAISTALCNVSIDADLVHHADYQLRDDVLESRYSRLQTLHTERLGELVTMREHMACQAENMAAHQDALIKSEAARDRLIKQNDELRSQIDALNSASDRALEPDDKRAWRGLEAFWLSLLVACIVVVVKNCGGV